jgi:hypothetical protein
MTQKEMEERIRRLERAILKLCEALIAKKK